ncbi:MAG: carboxypeptidase regulatory-like domain-containing protein [Verrucomicrobiota bacterium]
MAASLRLLLAHGFALLLAGPAGPAAARAAAPTGTLSGVVSNSATGNLLEGARVEAPALGLATLTDQTGRYVLNGLPAGTHEITVTYIGLDRARTTVEVPAGARAARDFDP